MLLAFLASVDPHRPYDAGLTFQNCRREIPKKRHVRLTFLLTCSECWIRRSRIFARQSCSFSRSICLMPGFLATRMNLCEPHNVALRPWCEAKASGQ
jgi:hypothetical protein